MGVKFCQVNAVHFDLERHQPICFDVGAMLCDPQTRGVKRKFDEDEDSEVSEIQDNHPATQRQSIFNISVCKLNKFRQMPDPDLLRSVLIRNTIRCIEREMERDGVKLMYGPSGSLFLPPMALNSSLGALNGVPEGGGNQGGVPVTYDCDVYGKCTPPVILPSVMSMSVVTENGYSTNNSSLYSAEYDRYLVNVDPSSGRMTPFVRTLYDRVDSGASWNEEGDRLTSLNWSSVLNFNSSANSVANSGSCVTYNGTQTSESHFNTNHSNSSFSGDPSSNHETLHTLTPLPTTAISNQTPTSTTPLPVSGGTSPASGSLSSSGSSEDEIFGDIDLSLYDFDLLSPLSPPSVKMAPVSAEELMRSLSSNTSDSIQSCQSGNYYKGDYFAEEREHVTPVVS